MFRKRASLAWLMLARFNAPAYVAIDYYMEAMPAPDRDAAADAILSVGSSRLFSAMPRCHAPKSRFLAGRFVNLVTDGTILFAEQELQKLKFLVHTALTTPGLSIIYPAASAVEPVAPARGGVRSARPGARLVAHPTECAEAPGEAEADRDPEGRRHDAVTVRPRGVSGRPLIAPLRDLCRGVQRLCSASCGRKARPFSRRAGVCNVE